MDESKYTRTVQLNCSTCGSADFRQGELQNSAQCTSCGRIFDRDELVRENGEKIESELEDMKTQVVGEITSEIREMFKKAFAGSKSIQFK